MNTISVNASRSYDVLVGGGLLAQLGSQVKKVTQANKIAIISDTNVWPLYGKTALESLEYAGFGCVVSYVFDSGEQSKSGQTYLAVLDFLAENHISRSDCVIALGGGVVGDLTGFAAATYLRGVDYVQVPTTLLACVDSSVGGKTAIDLPSGKNLAGAFYQPRLVLCDTDTLDTLPQRVFRDGCAEVIKYGVLYDTELFEHLKKYSIEFDRSWVISRCIELKRDVVAKDEFDRGARQKLNLGHTIGHGIEAYSNFAVSHGQAVAMGMAIVSRAGATNGICSDACRDDIIALIHAFGLPTETKANAESIYRCALSDKKRSGDSVNLIVPERIGSCLILPTDVSKLKAFIESGL